MTTYSGFVAVVGKPNVGKSTLVNALVGFKIAPTSSKPQTTRRQVRGIWTEGQRQIVFVDTPGMHKPVDSLGSFMQHQVTDSLQGVDAVVWMIDLRHPPTPEDRMVADLLQPAVGRIPVLLIGNKLDAAKRPDEALQAAHAWLPAITNVRQMSSLDVLAIATLRQELLRLLPEGPWYFPAEDKSDQSVRQWVGELVREAALHSLHQEIPHALAVKIETLEERARGGKKPGPITFIRAVMYVEREAQKPILIGKDASMLKRIGLRARKQLETVLGRPVYLELEVKVYPKWRKDKEALRQLDLT